MALGKKLDRISTYIELEDVLLTPFYVNAKNQRYELYEYELNIVVSDRPSFSEYATRYFGRELSGVPEKMVNRVRHCYIGVTKKAPENILVQLKEYVRFILQNQEIRTEIYSCMEEYEVSNLFFALY